MPVAIVHARAILGISAPPVTVEADLLPGLPGIQIVGLPETAVKESKERVKSALLNANFEIPKRKVTINLAPADLPKRGGRYDLAIAVAILVASRQLRCDPERLRDYELVGELSLDAGLRDIRGALPAVLAAREAGRRLILPLANGDEAALVSDADVMLARSLPEVVEHFVTGADLPGPATIPPTTTPVRDPLADVRGQAAAKRALVVAAAGGHNLLMEGPPGVGKTMLASRLADLLPSMTNAEALELACIRSVSGAPVNARALMERPFRSPHHTASPAALVGGSNPPRPGEVSLAHNGVLFLDEVPEFARRALEVLREPIESGRVAISRAGQHVIYPARFQLVAAMNPCPCGHRNTDPARCDCRDDQVRQYRARMSGPLLDRMDLHVTVTPPVADDLLDPDAVQEDTQSVLAIHRARAVMQGRGWLNAELPAPAIRRYCQVAPDASKLLRRAVDQLGISARGFYRSLKVARTIADLAGAEDIAAGHVREALAYRSPARQD